MLRALMLSAALMAALPAAAQDAQTLADIRAELGQLSSQIQGLRQELVASGAQGIQAAGGASALERMNAMEAQLSRLTSRTEALENRVNQVVADGTNRIGDLEFRLCELEAGCDISTLGQTSTLGGGAVPANPVTAAAPNGTPGASGVSMAMNEQSDFDRAKGVLDQGDFRGAADLFKTFAQTYPGGPLTGEALYLRGAALRQAGETSGAARAWLDAFSADPAGNRAPDSLLMLGTALGDLGQQLEACATLSEVPLRFPSASASGEARMAMQRFGCQ